MKFVSWQHCGLPMGVAPYDRPSPCLTLVVADLRARFAVTPGGGTGYNVRPIRGGELPSTHGYGAARDPKIPDDTQRQAAIDYLIAHHERSGVQAIHDYFGSRQWRANGNPGGVWLKVTPNRTTGWGQTWARYLHIEIHPDWWADTTPLDQRGPGYHPITNPTPTPPKVEDDPMQLIRAEDDIAVLLRDGLDVAWVPDGNALAALVKAKQVPAEIVPVERIAFKVYTLKSPAPTEAAYSTAPADKPGRTTPADFARWEP